MTGRGKFIVGNWKMNHTRASAQSWIDAVMPHVQTLGPTVRVGVAPPYPLLPVLADAVGSKLGVFAQEVYPVDRGAFTGAVSAPQVRDAGAVGTLVGHSERQQHFGETHESMTQRVEAALRADLDVLFCVGESKAQRRAGLTRSVVKDGLLAGLEPFDEKSIDRLTVAYEPVWAIGTGDVASPDDVEEVHRWIRAEIDAKFPGRGARCLILYGGSVTVDNCDELLRRPEIDGALVGGGSLDASSFRRIVDAAVDAS